MRTKHWLIVISVAVVIATASVFSFRYGQAQGVESAEVAQAARDSAIVEQARWQVRYEQANLLYLEQKEVTKSLVQAVEKLSEYRRRQQAGLRDAINRNDSSYVKNIILWKNARTPDHPASR